MRISEVRHQNFAALLEEYGDSLEDMARAINAELLKKDKGALSPQYLSQLKNRTRGIGPSTAEKLEIGTGKPPGWMDSQHAPSELERLSTDELVEWIIGTLPDLAPHHRLTIARAALSDLPKDSPP